MSKVFEICEIACSILLEESLRTHVNLYHIDLRNVVSHVCSSIDRNLYTLFIVFTNKVIGFGRYAFIHNKIIDRMIIDNDMDGLIREINLGKEMLREVYNNDKMTKEEIDTIDEYVNMERDIVLNMIDNYRPNGEIPTLMKKSDDTLYNKCRELVCIMTGRIPSGGFASNTVYLCDLCEGDIVPGIFCIDRHKLIQSLCDGRCINPHTNLPYSDTLKKQLMDRYSKEIKIYTFANEYM